MTTTPTILIADDDKDFVQGLYERCRRRGLNVVCAYDSLGAINNAIEHNPDVICLDIEMPSGSGLALCEMLASNEKLADVPVIILTGHTDPETVRRCHSLCAYYVPKLPDVWKHIEPLLEDLLGERLQAAAQPVPAEGSAPAAEPTAEKHGPTQPQGNRGARETPDDVPPDTVSPRQLPAAKDGAVAPQLVDVVFSLLGAEAEADASDEDREHEFQPRRTTPWVLCVDDDADYSMAMKLRLERYGVTVVRAMQGMEGYRLAFTRPADVILLDYELPNGQGDYILHRLRDNPVTRDIPVIIITGRKDRALERKMMNLGAARFLNKPLDFEVLLAELARHIEFAPVYSEV
jgi:CheY-like chemotaxis protein